MIGSGSTSKALARSATAAAAAALLLAAWTSVRFAAADACFRRNTLDSVRRAVELDSRNGLYHAWLAEHQELAGGDSRGEVESALRLNPMDARAWVRLGIIHELAGNSEQAGKCLTRAAAVSRLFEPRWALANFYFRHRDPARFRHWLTQSLETSYGDRSAIFVLATRAGVGIAELREAAAGCGRDCAKQLAMYAVRQEHPAEAGSIAKDSLAGSHPSERKFYVDLVDLLIARDAPGPAWSLWQGLCARGVLPYPAAVGAAVTNPSFSEPPAEAGFDWRLARSDFARPVRVAEPAALRLTLSGRQPDRTTLLAQFLAVEAGRGYRLNFLYRGDIPAGLSLRVEKSACELTAGEGWRGAAVQFKGGSGGLSEILLNYSRPAGQMRGEGYVELRDFRLEAAE